MKQIKLTNCDAVTLVSDEDYEYLAQFNWHRMATGYAGSTMGSDPRRKGESHPGPKTMHRVVVGRIVGEIPKGYEIDHANHDRLDNTRPNLRLCTRAQNMANMRAEQYAGSSQYKGVARCRNKWRAQISENDTGKHLGTFNSEAAAAAAYNRAAREMFGEFAVLNDVPDDLEDTPNPPRFNNRTGASGYRGVTKYRAKFIAQTSVNGKHVHLGVFDTPEEAARAWDRKMRELYGDDVPFNFSDEVQDT